VDGARRADSHPHALPEELSMSQRVLSIVEQPCVLCESTIQVWTLLHDEETGQEDWTIELVPHYCPGWKVVVKQLGRP
jgi:hypothetical protein